MTETLDDDIPNQGLFFFCEHVLAHQFLVDAHPSVASPATVPTATVDVSLTATALEEVKHVSFPSLVEHPVSIQNRPAEVGFKGFQCV